MSLTDHGSGLAIPGGMIRVLTTIATTLCLAGGGWWLVSNPDESSSRRARGQSATSGTTDFDTRQKEILRENLDKPADPVLAGRFATINAKHFSNSLQTMPVMWEPRLAEVGALAGRKFALLGVFGQHGDRTIILLHPSLKDDAAALDRALCHEMVHAYLYSLGDTSPDHGDSFQAVLRRLSNEGAFTGVAASTSERAELRAWLDAESTRLNTEREALAALSSELDQIRREIEQEPTPDKARRDGYNERAATMNRRTLEFRIAQDEYNQKVTRYNLMATYPDGLDGK